MNPTKEWKDRKPSETFSSKSKAFAEGIAELFDEILLSIQWNRPAILLVVHPSGKGQEKAKEALQKKLSSLSVDIIQIRPNSEHSDLFHFAGQTEGPDQFVYFVDGIGVDQDNYRALNLYREKLVEQKLIVVFWLTEKESMELPRLAPDFWAFRHRVIEFAASRGSRRKALPSGILMWQAELPVSADASIQEKIAFQKNLLQQLPSTDEALVLRADATYLLACYYWRLGEDEHAAELLQRELDHLNRLQVPDVVATFLNGLAIISYDQDNYDGALELLEKAIQLNPGDQSLGANLGVVQHGRGKSGQAVQTIKKTIKAYARSSWLWYILGYIHFSLGKLDLAVEAFQESSRLNVNNFWASCAIGVCHTQIAHSSEWVQARQLLESSTTGLNLQHEICAEALSGNKAVALDKLRIALSSGVMTRVSLKRDPALAMILDTTKMEFLL
jgi:tetratricopeptide (TPR) repeat protein